MKPRLTSSIQRWRLAALSSLLAYTLGVSGFAAAEDVFSLQRVNINDQWQVLDYPDTGALPVVIAGVPGFTGQQPGIVAVNNVTRTGASISFKEWNYLDGAHTSEQVATLTLPQGRHVMSDGSIWEVGRFRLSGTRSWQPQSFLEAFSAPPKLFLTAQTSNGSEIVTTRVQQLSSTGFLVALFEQESLNNGHTTEAIGYLAIDSTPGSGVIKPQEGELAYTLQNISLNSDFQGGASQQLKLEEEQSRDAEIAHVNEIVSVLTLDGALFAQTISFKGSDTISIRQEPVVEALLGEVNITLEAEDYSRINSVNHHDRFNQNTRADASGNTYMQGVGDNGNAYLEYDIVLPVDDVYQIYVRGTGASSSQNSFLVSVDGGADSVVQLNSDDTWGWTIVEDANSGLGPYILPKGTHTIRIKKRESNAELDQLRISSNTNTNAPVANFSPSSLDFSNQSVGSVSDTKVVDLTNTGNVPLNISNIRVVGDFNESNNCGDLLQAGAGCQLTLRFAPLSAGNLSGTLTVESNDANSPAQVSLSGTGNIAQASSFALSWTTPVSRSDGSALPPSEIAGYRIYYGASPGNYPNSIDVTNITAKTINNITVGTYYVVMTTRDTAGRESTFSQEITKVAQ